MPWETISPDERKFKHTGIEPNIEWNLGPGERGFIPLWRSAELDTRAVVARRHQPA